jgi:hypothetical protein
MISGEAIFHLKFEVFDFGDCFRARWERIDDEF